VTLVYPPEEKLISPDEIDFVEPVIIEQDIDEQTLSNDFVIPEIEYGHEPFKPWHQRNIFRLGALSILILSTYFAYLIFNNDLSSVFVFADKEVPAEPQKQISSTAGVPASAIEVNAITEDLQRESDSIGSSIKKSENIALVVDEKIVDEPQISPVVTSSQPVKSKVIPELQSELPNAQLGSTPNAPSLVPSVVVPVETIIEDDSDQISTPTTQEVILEETTIEVPLTGFVGSEIPNLSGVESNSLYVIAGSLTEFFSNQTSSTIPTLDGPINLNDVVDG